MNMKESYQQKLQAHLDEWSAEIDKLKARADKADADVRLEYYEQIEALREKQEAAKDKLTELMTAGDDAWEDLKAGTEIAGLALSDAISKATSRFK
jgi:uncharacterized coiled-coil DUF342 family protein